MLRLARPADLTAVHEIYMHPRVIPFLTHEPMGRAEFRPVFDELVRGGGFHVWESTGAVVGFCRVSRYPGRAAHGAQLGTFAIHPDFHGKGVARGILDAVVRDLADRGVWRIDLMVEADNARAIAFYEKYGFEREGVMRSAYKRAHERHYVDELVMALLLEPPR